MLALLAAPISRSGGLCDRARVLRRLHRRRAAARSIPPAFRWWELVARLRWAVIALQQGHRRASGAEALSLALTARIADTVELMALRMTAPRGAS